MTFDEIIAEAKDLITKNKIEDCLSLVASNLKEDHTNDLILLQRRYAEIKIKSQRGITPTGQYNTDMNKFVANLLDTINTFSSNHFKEVAQTVSSAELDSNSLIEKLLEATREIENLKAQIELGNLQSNNNLITVKMIIRCDAEILNNINQYKCICKIWDNDDYDDEITKEVPIRPEPGGLTVTLQDIKPQHFIQATLIKKDDSDEITSDSFSPKQTIVKFKKPVQ